MDSWHKDQGFVLMGGVAGIGQYTGSQPASSWCPYFGTVDQVIITVFLAVTLKAATSCLAWGSLTAIAKTASPEIAWDK